jgi:NTP pyrophosphatase (non-canonical NTP hydrolase)
MPSQPNEAPASTPSPPAGPTLDRALELVRFLRQNCPWDAAQTPESLVPYLLEESHEVADAIAAGVSANKKELTDELGDLLLNVAFQIVLAEERSDFSAEDVVRALSRRRDAAIHSFREGGEETGLGRH